MPNELLTLTEIVQALSQSLGREVKYPEVRAYADEPGVKQFMGAVNAPGSKGVKYPPEAVQSFAVLLQAREAGQVTPKTASIFLANLKTDAGVPLPQAGSQALVPRSLEAIAPLLQSVNQPVVTAVAELIAVLKQSHNDAPPEDQLLTAQEAGVLLACAPSSVRRYVPSVRRGRWRRSDILRHIAGLRQ